MKLDQFQRIDPVNQWEIFQTYSRFITQTVQGQHSFSLYVFGSFYIELEFSLIEGKTIGLNSFAYGPQLDKYLHCYLILIL